MFVALLGKTETLNCAVCDTVIVFAFGVTTTLVTETVVSGFWIGLPQVLTVNCLDAFALLPELSVTV